MKTTILNGKELMSALHISTTRLYKFINYGMPYHQIGRGRKYYILPEVEEWLLIAGYRQKTTWTKESTKGRMKV